MAGTKLTKSLLNFLKLSGGTMTGNVDMDDNDIQNANLDDVGRIYFDASGSRFISDFIDDDTFASDVDANSAASSESIKAYVDSSKKIWSGNTYGTRMGVLNNWYLASQSLGLSITAADFVDDSFEKNYYPFFIAPHVCTVESIGFAGGTNYANDYEIEFWHVNYDSTDTSADAATKVGSTISLSAPGTTAMLSSVETGLSVALAAGDCVFHVCRFTSGSTNKYLYINPVIGYK